MKGVVLCTIFYACNHVFETEMYDTADLPRVGSIGGKLKRMQEEFALPRNYEEWVLYFRHYKTYCEMLAKRGNILELPCRIWRRCAAKGRS